jgi:hypothetical protein
LYLALSKQKLLDAEELTFIGHSDGGMVRNQLSQFAIGHTKSKQSSNDQWQIDLIDFSKYSRWNKGFKYLGKPAVYGLVWVKKLHFQTAPLTSQIGRLF